MFITNIITFMLFFFYGNCDDVTFKNVDIFTMCGSLPTVKTHIESGNRLKDYLPKEVLAIQIQDQNIPVLYPGSISDLDKVLTIQFCNVEELKPDAFINADILILNIRDNKIKSIDYGVFNNVSISNLDLSFNEISTIHPQAFDDMTNLTGIKLDHNKIKVWNPDWFKNTPVLSRVSFQYNKIQKLPAHAFKNTKGGELPVGVIFFKVDLFFSHNKINEIDPEAFADLENIDKLNLDNNFLENFDENLLKNIKIKSLILTNNKIKCLGDVGKVLKAKKRNAIDSNPMYCDCLDKVKEYAQYHIDNNVTFSQITCEVHDED